ncbi:hypothetical protein B7Y94_00615 [Candidatus Saccharibacteria bacterium 32-49-12]|nr:MAG: hypothetical protein B7Y94_00615 [Candidatus Saccharibacteria bacterium 32-49-12]
MKHTSHGFTVIELVVVIAFLAIASVIFFAQKNNLEIGQRDETRKTAINAMYYSLEEVYFAQNKHYPRTLNEDALPSVDPALFKDTNGVMIGDSASEYRYEPVDCDGDKCLGYTLRADLENEADFIKQNRRD